MRHFSQGSLVLFLVVYVLLMSVAAGTAIPGGLFVPSILVRLPVCLFSFMFCFVL